MKLALTTFQGESVVVEITKEETKIGRDPECDVVLKNDKLSRVHCIFFYDRSKGRMAVTDPGSKNGILVNGAIIEKNIVVPINTNSVVILGGDVHFNTFLGDTVPKMGRVEAAIIRTPSKRLKDRSDKEIRDEDRAFHAKTLADFLKESLKFIIFFGSIITALAYYIAYK